MTLYYQNLPSIVASSSAVGPKEGEGPLADEFDFVAENADLGEDSWEKAESALQKKALTLALNKANVPETEVSVLFAGDLLNQCVGSAYAARDKDMPFVGLYGACSTMAESLIMAGAFVNAGYCATAAAMTSSHFCSAERQFRNPLNYGGQRTPTSQWTATAAGAAVLGISMSGRASLKCATIGKIRDMGIKDPNNMGAAMSYAAYDTIAEHMRATGTTPDDYDLILTGDLGQVGSGIMLELFAKDGIDLTAKHNDCGLMLFDNEKQDAHAGASGCGCSAAVMCGYIIPKLARAELGSVLFAATGALMSPTLCQQGESIPSISHAVHIIGGECKNA